MKNTSTDPHPEWLLGGHPDAIARQEAAGQRAFVASNLLPTACRADDKEALEAAGLTFGPPLSDDPLFCKATLPTGWALVSSDHDCWSYLHDETGQRRAAIFYKAAFYDRDAFMRLA